MPLTESSKRYYFANSEPTYLQDYDAHGNLIYEGWSATGTPLDKPGFVIMKHVYQTVTIGGATIYEDVYDSKISGAMWSLRTLYTYP